MVSLQNNILKLSDAVLTKPIERLAKMLDENPKGLEMAIKGVGIAMGVLTAMKAFSSIVMLLANLKGLRGGKIGASLSGPGVPVHVTNAGAMGSGGGMTGQGNPIPANQNNPLPAAPGNPQNAVTKAAPKINPAKVAGTGILTGITAAFIKIPQMVAELKEIKHNENLTDKERREAKGGAIGDASLSIAGAAGGAALEAAIGSVVPGLGTAIGFLLGGALGAAGMHFGGKGGRKLGEMIGGSVADNSVTQGEPSAGVNERSGQASPEITSGTRQSGNATISNRQQFSRANTPAGAATQHITRSGSGIPEQAAPEAPGRMPQPQAAGRVIPPMQLGNMARIPESALPPHIVRNETTIIQPARAEIEGNASIDVNVNLSGERPAANVSVRSNNIPFLNFHSRGNAPQARLMSL